MNNKHKGILSVLISAVIFGSMPLIAKVVYKENCNSMSLTLYRFLLSLPLLFFLLKRENNEEFKMTIKEFYKICLVGILGFSSTPLLLYTSYNYISTGTATTLHFIYPVLVILGGVLFFKDKPNLIKITSVVLCVLGILMFYQGNSGINIKGMLIAFSSGLTFSFYILFIEKSELRHMHTIKLTFYLSLVASIVLLIVCVMTGNLSLNMTFKGWMLSSLLSVIVTFGGICLFQNGIKLIGSQNTSILSTLEPITSILIGILIFKEAFNFRIILGFVFISIATTLIAVFEK
jgi:drug/metabolite transporter (DMT)-like permease